MHMKRISLLILLFIVAILGLSFAVLNADMVALKYYFGEIRAPLSLIIVLSLACGALLGVAATMTIVLRLRRELSRLNKTIKLTEKEVANLRALPLKAPL